MPAACPACDLLEKRLEFTPQTAPCKGNWRLRLHWKLPLWRLVRAHTHACTHKHIGNALLETPLKQWKRSAESRAGRLLQAVRFNAAVNITSHSYSSSMLVNITVSPTLATSRMTATGQPFLPARGDGLRMELGMPAHGQPRHPSRRGRKRKRRGTWHRVSSRNVADSSSVIDRSGSGLFRNYPGTQRQPESSLWSLAAASDLPKMPRWRMPASGSLSSPPAPGGAQGQGKTERLWCSARVCMSESVYWVLQSCQTTVLMQPSL